MRSIFLKLSATALTGFALVIGSSAGISSAAQATSAPTTVASAAAVATTAPLATTSAVATSAAVATTSAMQYPACPNPNATAVATSAATNAATSVATTAATAPVNSNPGYLGVAAQSVQNCGAQILDVRPGSAAETAKLQIGDVVVAVDHQAINGVDQFRQIVTNHKPGDKITITYQRSGQQFDTTATLGTVPAATAATQAATAAP